MKKEIKKGTKYFDLNENENTPYQNVWDATKAIFRGNYCTKWSCMKRRKASNQWLQFPP